MYSFTVLEAKSFKSGCLQRYAPFEVSRGESSFASSCFWSLLAILAISWFVDASFRSSGLPFLSVFILHSPSTWESPNACLCIQICACYKDSSDIVWAHFILSLWRIYIQKRPHFEVLGFRITTYYYRRDTIQPIAPNFQNKYSEIKISHILWHIWFAVPSVRLKTF